MCFNGDMLQDADVYAERKRVAVGGVSDGEAVVMKGLVKVRLLVVSTWLGSLATHRVSMSSCQVQSGTARTQEL